MPKLEGKVALISGGARGLGAVQATLLAKEGAKVVLGDILDEQGKQVEVGIAESGGDAIYVHLDVTSETQWENVVQTAVSSYGKLDILVNNAGIVISKGVEETTAEDWDKIMDINGKGVFLGTKVAIPAMREARGGSIINISTIGGIVGVAGFAAYCATKGAVRLLTKATAIQYAKDGIRCNSVHPGMIKTDMTAGMSDSPERLQEILSNIPMGYMGTSEDVANGVLFLASDESSYMTGSELVIDGGIVAQ